MPVFQYEPYRNPYGPSIAEALANQADPQAAAALRAGDIQARAAAQRGALQGQLWSTLGTIPAQIQAAQQAAQQQAARAQQLQLGGLQLDAAKRDAQSRAAFDAVVQDPANYRPDGSPDHARILQGLRQRSPAAALAFEQQLSESVKRGLELQKLQGDIGEKTDKARETEMGHLSDIALTAGTLLAQTPEQPLQVRDLANRMVTRQVANKTITPERANAFYLQMAQAGPTEIGPLLQGLVPPERRAEYDQKVAAAAAARAGALRPITVGGTAISPPNPDDPTAPPTVYYTAPPKDTHSPAYLEWQDYRAQGGPLGFDAYMSKDANRKATRLTVAGQGSPEDIKDAVQGMIDGRVPPQLPGRASAAYTAMLAEAQRRGYNLAGAATDWTATQKHIATMNGAQQLRLNQAVNALPEMLDKVDTLAQQWKGGPFPVLNRVNLGAAKNGVYGKDVAKVAVALDGQIADVVADLGNVYMGGNSPTDHALQLAGKSLSADWDADVLRSMVQLAKDNVKIRRNSINNTGVAGASDENPYMPPGRGQTPPPAAAPAAPVRGEVRSQDGERRMWDGGGWVRVK